MSSDTKELSRRILDEVWNHRNLNAADEMLSPEFVMHEPQSPAPIRGVAAYKEYAQRYLNAFSDLCFVVEDHIAEGDSVATRWHVTGTHSGELFGLPATGRKVSISGMSYSRIADGKFVESWTHFDSLGLMQQLGAVPTQAVEQAA